MGREDYCRQRSRRQVSAPASAPRRRRKYWCKRDGLRSHVYTSISDDLRRAIVENTGVSVTDCEVTFTLVFSHGVFIFYPRLLIF